MCPSFAADVLGKNQLLRQGDMKSEVGIWLGGLFWWGPPEIQCGEQGRGVVVAPGLLQPSLSQLLFAMVENR